jgi:DNA-binding GntR family transcriptional regulator
MIKKIYKRLLTFLYEIIYDLNMKGIISKQKMAYELIRERILDGTYSPGTRIVLDAVAKEIGTSSIPVREAIRRLEADGLIEYQAFTGARVAPMDETAYVQSLNVLAVLEGYATVLSASRLTEADFRRLREINEAMEEALEDFDFVRFGNLNRDFHQMILEKCGNDVLKEQIRQIWGKLDAVRQRGVWHIPSRAKESIAEHAHLLELMERKAPAEEIERAARQHKWNTATAFLHRRERSV